MFDDTRDLGPDPELGGALRRLADSAGSSARPLPPEEVRRRGRVRRTRRVTVSALATAALLIGAATAVTQLSPTATVSNVAVQPPAPDLGGPEPVPTVPVMEEPGDLGAPAVVPPTAAPSPPGAVPEAEPTDQSGSSATVPGFSGEVPEGNRDPNAPVAATTEELEQAVQGALVDESELGVSGIGPLQRSTASGTDNCVPYTIPGLTVLEREDRYSTDGANGWVWQSAQILPDAAQAERGQELMFEYLENCAPDNVSERILVPGGAIGARKLLECKPGVATCKPREMVMAYWQVGRVLFYMQYTKDRDFDNVAAEARIGKFFTDFEALPVCEKRRCETS